MSSAVLPSRERCIHTTDSIQQCQCPWFASLLLYPYICGRCGHGIHAHVDYISMVVNHFPPAQCAAYAQKTPLTQCCICETWLSDHVAINNPFRYAEPWNVLVNFMGSNDASQGVDAINHPNVAINGPFAPFSPVHSDTDVFSRDVNLTPITVATTFSPSPRHAFIPFSDAGNIPFAPFMPSPSASSTPSGTQSDVTQAQGYGSDHYFVQYPDHSMDNLYAHQPGGGAAGENFEFRYYSPNTMHGATPEARSDPYIQSMTSTAS